ncbi:hypothetical protein BDV95DRAFT_85075 [Massariosphaeria phaeospora]|uniref:Secreted protein n=1 Tax=Massariosphaeria phaeospora TaxID=100035 RepID=A0A7C8I6Z7_9PLEO|nr:hypothetical protein BDV95DRAFT_85075 [Massariosphaeria phaeospora]
MSLLLCAGFFSFISVKATAFYSGRSRLKIPLLGTSDRVAGWHNERNGRREHSAGSNRRKAVRVFTVFWGDWASWWAMCFLDLFARVCAVIPWIYHLLSRRSVGWGAGGRVEWNGSHR